MMSGSPGHGNYRPHTSHDTGLAVDIRLPGKMALSGQPSTINQYDPTAAEAII